MGGLLQPPDSGGASGRLGTEISGLPAKNIGYMITISLRSIILRLALFLILLGGVVMIGKRVVLTALSESFSSYVERTPSLPVTAQLEATDQAVRYAPFNPLARLQRGGRYLAAATEEGSDDWAVLSIEELRRAAELAPADYRISLALGRALDRLGDAAGARSAYERTLQLAPNYFDSHWAFGNHLLRTGDRESAFLRFRQALALRPSAFSLIFDYAWEAYDGDVGAIITALAPAPRVQAGMASLLARRNSATAALAAWQLIPSPAPDDVREFTLSLLQSGRPGDAWRVWSAANLPEQVDPDPGSLLVNGGFEQAIQLNTRIPFRSWQISAPAGVRVTVDRQSPDEGTRSLRVSFSLENNSQVAVATQVVKVDPEREYCLSFSLRTEELKSLSLPRIELYDTASPDRAYAATPPFPAELASWTDQTLRLRTANTTESLTVRLLRPPCADPFCSIEGRVWLDQIRLNPCRDR